MYIAAKKIAKIDAKNSGAKHCILQAKNHAKNVLREKISGAKHLHFAGKKISANFFYNFWRHIRPVILLPPIFSRRIAGVLRSLSYLISHGASRFACYSDYIGFISTIHMKMPAFFKGCVQIDDIS